MPVDSDLALHCLEDLGGRKCPIVKQRADAMKPDVCDGLSIRDTLFSFLCQAIGEEFQLKARGGNKKRIARILGQQEALTYAIALIDNPYDVNTNRVREAARMEVRNPPE
jgi:hypothetical protein